MTIFIFNLIFVKPNVFLMTFINNNNKFLVYVYFHPCRFLDLILLYD